MVKRRTSSTPSHEAEAEDRHPSRPTTMRDLRSRLAIDRDDLDGCLVDQPELYYHVTQSYTRAVSERDEVKLELEEVSAELDKQIRRAAEEADEKLTEARIQQEIKLRPRYRELRQLLLEKTEAADNWQALKEAFQQRSFMLRELVSLYVSERHDIAGAGGAYEARERRAEAARSAAGQLRRGRRQGGNTEAAADSD